MPAKLAVVEKNGMVRSVSSLKPGCHLARVERVAVSIGIAGDDHRGGIGHALPNLMIWRVLCEGGEIVRVVHSAKLIAPEVRVVEEVVPKHIQHRNHADDGTKQ